jgi:anti-sigma28 factor (negative regulator of flagellin synthesis)
MIRGVGNGFQPINSTQQNKTEKTQKQEKLSRVEEIKKEIQNGTYKVDIQKTAEAMAKTLL